ncbi:MAG: CRISPR-associated protein Cas4 [Ignavibacteria bacterium]|nr:CRISPR-associated protein Cas4 [Ignavibacteria bacterium]
MSITPSHIIEYLFCPRYTYFEYVLCIPQFEEKYYKVIKGRELHSDRLKINRDYLRQRIGVTEKYLDQYLTNENLRGQVDEVLLLSDGTMAPLDYKFAEYKEKLFETYKTQLYCYAILIESNYGKEVCKGFLVYTRSRNKLLEVNITDSDKRFVNDCTKEIVSIINDNYFPKATKYKLRCVNCTYRNICVK